tara:strand:- start:1001 stop:1183 length:183 start_codon:yes stop_codon:yes gene_type:complete
MSKKIRSISIAEKIDEQLQEDSDYRGLTISANVSRILYDYFAEQTKGISTGRKLPVTKNK